MNGKQTKKLIWETNTPPPTNYIWVKPNGKPYEFNNTTKKWEESNIFGGISENMSEEEQMEVRKNLGLYYEETSVVEKSVTFNDFDSMHLSDDVPTKDNIVKVVNYGGVESDIKIVDSSEGYTILGDGYYLFSVTEDGINALGGNIRGTTLFYKMSGTISKIDAKFLPKIQFPGPVVLKNKPSTLVSQQFQLNNVGITYENLIKLVTGEATGLCLKTDSNPPIIARLNLEYVTYSDSDNFELQFTDKTDRYSVVNNNGTITVTKTSLS